MASQGHDSKFSFFAISAVLVSSAVALAMIAFAMYEPVLAQMQVNRDMRIATYLQEARNNILLTYNIAEAEKNYKKVIAVDPFNEEALYELVRVYLVEGKYPEALALATRFNALYPDKTRILYVGGLVAGYGGNLPLAEQLFNEYIQRESTASWPSRLDLSWALVQQGKFADAEKILVEQLKTHANNPWLLNNLGVAYIGLEKKAEAKKILSTAKKVAEQISEEDWAQNYSFNNPVEIGVTLAMFKQIVAYNLGKAQGNPQAIPPLDFSKIGSLSPKGLEGGIVVAACGDSCGPILCTSPANACGQTRQVTINTCINPNWTCSGVQPPYLPGGSASDPDGNYGETCTGTNSCGITDRGTIGCDGQCKVTTGLPANYGVTCTIRNSCGSASGTIRCDGSCSATRPPCADGDDVLIIGGEDTNGDGVIDERDTGGTGTTIFARISAVPLLIHRNQTSTIKWETQNTTSCTVTGNTGTAVDTWNFVSGNGSRISSAIVRETPYTLTCTGKNGQQLTSSVTIRIVPDWQEI
jgi:tetratricopeptide (TPR) repeat protein